jgi:N-acetylmuramoyl-L-alanine amidase
MTPSRALSPPLGASAPRHPGPRLAWAPLLGVLLLLLLPGMSRSGPEGGAVPGAGGALHAQLAPGGIPSAPAFHLELRLPGGAEARVPVYRHRGYPALPARELAPLEWARSVSGNRLVLRHRTGITLQMTEGSPWVQWDDELLQLAHQVYAFGDDLLVPLQLLADIFPGMLPAAYRYEPATRTLVVHAALQGGAGRGGESGGEPSPGQSGGGAGPPGAPAAEGSIPPPEEAAPVSTVSRPDADAPRPLEPAARAPRSRVVVIDAGHGGDEPGAVGPGGTREKQIALAVALALARELEAYPWIEVHLTRDRDVSVPIWERGERATAWKGERPGVFVSIHANAVPDRPQVRGFETYFLSEARTEHERRVAAAENAPLRRERPDAPGGGVEDPFLAGILRDLMTHDHQQWSAYLADRVQRELATFHPGPDRGVKQGPFAVLTNALMPSVLVELGFITNRAEEQLMMQPQFHRESAAALARAIRDFFDRYPPGGTG